jgi:hypothetical protein
LSQEKNDTILHNKYKTCTEKAKPVARWGRKAMGLLIEEDRQAAKHEWCLFFFTKRRIKSG